MDFSFVAMLALRATDSNPDEAGTGTGSGEDPPPAPEGPGTGEDPPPTPEEKPSSGGATSGV